MVSVFLFQNYREYLKEYYDEEKRLKPFFSYRYFSRRADINSSAFLYHVISGARNCTPKSIEKICKAIGHSLEEADYFRTLVGFNQSKTVQEKADYYNKLIERKAPLDVSSVAVDKYAFYRKWYHSVIRELVTIYPFEGNYTKLGKMLMPAISAKEAELSIKQLLHLGFIEINSEGVYQQSETTIMTVPSGEDAFIIKQFQMEMLELALQCYDTLALPEFVSASTTFCISEKTFELFKLRTRDFRRELQGIAKLDDVPDCVYQYTFNLFPVTKKVGHNDE